MLIVLLSKRRAWADPSCAWKISCAQAVIPAGLNAPSEDRSLNYAFVIEKNASEREFESVFFRTNSTYRSGKLGTELARTVWTKPRTILSMFRQPFATLYCCSGYERSQKPLRSRRQSSVAFRAWKQVVFAQ